VTRSPCGAPNEKEKPATFSLDGEDVARYTRPYENFVMKRVCPQHLSFICGVAMRKTWLAHANAHTAAGVETATKG